MQKATKGQFGYFRYERMRRLLITIITVLFPAAVFVAGIIVYGTERNLLTVIALVLVIPFAMAFVSLVMVYTHSSIPEDEYKEIEEHAGTLTMAYELYVTHETASTMVDAFAICGSTVVGLVTEKKGDPKFTADYIKKVLRSNGIGSNVALMTDRKHFLERLDSMNEHSESLRDVKFKPDSRYPDYDLEQTIWIFLTQISL
ncbi:MAG: hypothetical protein IKD59_03095 [Lachnospiraceae bacterium]|nr:hypothetical protein [Lachnospiraceae bacterium]